jgi:SAM-dependent methyltransferase
MSNLQASAGAVAHGQGAGYTRVLMRDTEYATMHDQEMVHWWFRGRRVLLRDLIERHLRFRAGTALRLLDLGCGTGGNSATYTEFGSVVGVEPDASALRFAQARLRAEGPATGLGYCRAAGTSLPLARESFDAVIASDVLEHIADDRAAVAEIGRVLRPGGVFVFSVPAHPWLWSTHDDALWHQRRYRRAELKRLIAEGGLDLRWLTYWNAVLFPVVAMHRVFDRRPRDEPPASDATLPLASVNRLLFGILRAEAAALRVVRLPFGVSLVGVAVRPLGGRVT